jgi:hypothetical protein
VVGDILDAMAEQGFRRILIVNGHGGNAPAQSLAGEWMSDHPEIRIKFHNWWDAPKTWAEILAIDSIASHASWMENFPWTRLANVIMPDQQKPMSDLEYLRQLNSRSGRNAPIVNRSLVDNGTLQPLGIPSEYACPARTEESRNSRNRLAPLTSTRSR